MDLIYKPGNEFPGDAVYPTNKTGRALLGERSHSRVGKCPPYFVAETR